MRPSRKWLLTLVGIGLMLGLTGCQPGERGQTGLMLGSDGLVYGVVNVCNGSVAVFDLVERTDYTGLGAWFFDNPVSSSGSVALGTPSELAELLNGSTDVYFSAGTHGVVGVTTPLVTSQMMLDDLKPGEVVYSDWNEDGEPIISTVSGFDAFAALSCEGY